MNNSFITSLNLSSKPAIESLLVNLWYFLEPVVLSAGIQQESYHCLPHVAADLEPEKPELAAQVSLDILKHNYSVGGV